LDIGLQSGRQLPAFVSKLSANFADIIAENQLA
jgi:hypothetical protein